MAKIRQQPHTVHTTMSSAVSATSKPLTVSAPRSNSTSKTQFMSTSTCVDNSDRHGLKYATEATATAKRFPITNKLTECIIGVSTNDKFLTKKAMAKVSYPGLNRRIKNEQARQKPHQLPEYDLAKPPTRPKCTGPKSEGKKTCNAADPAQGQVLVWEVAKNTMVCLHGLQAVGMNVAPEGLNKWWAQGDEEELHEETKRLHQATWAAGKAGLDHYKVCNNRPNCEEQRYHQCSNQKLHFRTDASNATHRLQRLKERLKS